MIVLRPYQTKLLADISEQFKSGHRAVMAQCPTGSGKTACAVEATRRALARGKRVLFQAHTRTLVAQTLEKFNQFGISAGVIMSGHPRTSEPLQIGSVQTISRRLDKVDPFDLIISDEAHRSMGASFRAAMSAWPNAYNIGLTATPERLDGRGFGDIYTALVCGPQVRELVAAGHLAPFRVFAPAVPDLRGVHTAGGDYNDGELSAAMDRPHITGDAVEHFLKLGGGRQALAYCCTIEHATNVAAQFNAAGIVTSLLHSKMSADQQLAALDGLRSGAVRNMVSVSMVSEGFDVPAVTCAILLRPTKSLVLACQQWGRANRGGSDEPALILDHAGSTLIHGHPEQDREWSLAGREKTKRGEANTVSVVRCHSCFSVYQAGPAACPNCGAANAIVRSPTKQVKGELVEFTGPADTPEKLRAMAMAKKWRPGYIIRLLAAREGCSMERAAIKLGYHPGIVQYLKKRVS